MIQLSWESVVSKRSSSVAALCLTLLALPIRAQQSDESTPVVEPRALQDRMRADPETMDAIEQLRDDPQVQEVLQDPSVTEALREGDMAALLANPKIRELVANPSVQDITRGLEK
jgi:hypothetical protein